MEIIAKTRKDSMQYEVHFFPDLQVVAIKNTENNSVIVLPDKLKVKELIKNCKNY